MNTEGITQTDKSETDFFLSLILRESAWIESTETRDSCIACALLSMK